MATLNYTTYADVERFKANRTVEEQRVILKAAASVEQKDTFLSHSSKDNDLVPGVLAVLEGHGGKVYVDLGDDQLPKNPSAETGQVLRDAVKRTRRFVLLVTKHSKDSIWIPWELGLADGGKGEYSVALFPVVEYVTETEWTKQEYLGLYRRIVWGGLQGEPKDLWIVYNHHKHTADKLSSWLRGS
jgi:hypothetical protein